MTWKDLWKTSMGVVMRDFFFKDDVDGYLRIWIGS
jgi:hypothetical protein